MATREPVRLGTVPETLLVPLYARAVESRRKRPILEDPKASAMVESIDWDFARFGQRWRVLGCTLRGAMFDECVKKFLRSHAEGTVVEIGSGLNTRFERLDNGCVRWFDLDLPEVAALRRKFFADSERRTTLAASVLETGWMAAVRRSPGPYLFVAETVFAYLAEREVKAALAQLAENFPSATLLFDTLSRRAVDGGNRDHARRKLDARFAWGCEDAREIEDWNIGLRLVESLTIADVPAPLRARLSRVLRISLSVLHRLFPQAMKVYQLNLFAAQPAG